MYVCMLFDCNAIICRVYCVSYARCVGLQFHDIGECLSQLWLALLLAPCLLVEDYSMLP